MEKSLLKDFKDNPLLNASDPLFAIALNDSQNGTVSCLIGDCKKYPVKKSLTRTTKRAWSVQNLYRHVRAAHCDAEKDNEGGKRQKMLTDYNIHLESNEDSPTSDGEGEQPQDPKEQPKPVHPIPAANKPSTSNSSG